MATDAQIAVIRSWVGSAADLDDIDERLERLGTPEAAALEVLRTQLADLLASPTRLDVDGDVTADWTTNVEALSARIKTLEGVVGGQGTTGVGTVTIGNLRRGGARR